jgi:hypothetical protein
LLASQNSFVFAQEAEKKRQEADEKRKVLEEAAKKIKEEEDRKNQAKLMVSML